MADLEILREFGPAAVIAWLAFSKTLELWKPRDTRKLGECTYHEARIKALETRYESDFREVRSVLSALQQSVARIEGSLGTEAAHHM